MKNSRKNKISKILLFAAVIVAFTMQIQAQTLIVNESTTIENQSTPNVVNIESNEIKKETKLVNIEPKEGAGISKEELVGGTWVLTGVESKSINGVNITKWQNNNNVLQGNCSWKDVLNIIHTVESGFSWQDPPKKMQPGSYLNLEAVYTNIDYSTTSQMNTGIKMFFAGTNSDFKVIQPNSVEVLKVNKDSKHYANEVKKGFYYAPKNYFDDTNICNLVVDCYVGKDHYVTTYTYTYQQ